MDFRIESKMSDSIIKEQEEAIQVDYEKGNFSFPEDYTYDAGTGLNEETVAYISKVKNEAEWVKEFRLKALEIFNILSRKVFRFMRKC